MDGLGAAEAAGLSQCGEHGAPLAGVTRRAPKVTCSGVSSVAIGSLCHRAMRGLSRVVGAAPRLGALPWPPSYLVLRITLV